MAIAENYDDTDENSKLLRSNPPYSDGDQSCSIFERPEMYKSRWRSIRVMYLTMFLSSVSFSICMSSVWPYLKLLDPSAKADFLGWVVASYSLGQLIASPLFGTWATKRGKSREPLVVSIIINILANILYIYLESIPTSRDAWLVVARTFIGFGAGNVAVVRSYVSGATKLKERTPAMANISACQAIGFIIGPGIQTAMVPIGYPGAIHITGFHLDLYTAPALLSAVCGIINLVLLIVVFREHRVENDDDINFSINVKTDIPDYSVDKVAVVSSVFIFFIVLFLFAVFETIATPLTMHMYSWTKSEATLYNGVILATGGVVSILVFIVIKILSKRFNERYLLIGGFIFCFMGFFVYLPWGNQFPSYKDANINPAPTIPGNHTLIIQNATTMPWTESTINTTIPWTESTTNTTMATFIHSTITDQPIPLQNATLLPTTEKSTIIPTTKNSIPLENGTIIHTVGTTELTSSFEQTTVTDINIENSTDIPTSNHIVNVTGMWIENATDIKTTQHTAKDNQYVSSERKRQPTKHKLNLIFTDKENKDEYSYEEISTTRVMKNSTSEQWTYQTGNGSIFTTHPSNGSKTTIEPVGCPDTYKWCRYTPIITLAQFLAGTLLICIGYPTCNVMSYSIYSKILGPKPQGIWMGILTAAGSLARTLGPIFVSQIYNSYGPRVTFSIVVGLIVATFGMVIAVFRKLVPFSFELKQTEPQD